MTDFVSGDQVAVKAEGYPFWPAIIADVATLVASGLEDPGDGYYPLQYYGTGEGGFAPKDPATIIKFDANHSEWLANEDESLKAAIEQAVAATAPEEDASSGDEDDDVPPGGDSTDPAVALEERERKEKRKREKKEKKKLKEKKRQEKELRKKEKEDDERRRKKEAKKASHSHDKKKHRHHHYDDDNDDGTVMHSVAANERLQKQRRLAKKTLSDAELQQLSNDLDVAVDMSDELATRTILSELCKINVSLLQMKKTQIGIRLSSVLDSALYAAKPIVLVLVRSWVHAAPENQRKAVMALSQPGGVGALVESNGGDAPWNGAQQSAL